MFEFVVLGSTGSHYVIEASRSDYHLRLSCTCEAGQNGTYCKHRIGLLCGSVDGLLSENPDDVRGLCELLKGSDLEAILAAALAADRALESAKTRRAAAFKKLGRSMNARD